MVDVSVNVTVCREVPDVGEAVKLATGEFGLDKRIRSITLFRIAVIFSLLVNPIETIVLADALLPSFLINEAT